MDPVKSILIIDDEPNIRKYLSQSLEKEGFEVHASEYGQEGFDLLIKQHVDIVLLDLNLPDISGLEILKEIKKVDIETVSIIITAFGDVASAVEAMKLGAYDYLTKPFDIEDIKIVINKALRIIGLENKIRLLERQDRFRYGELITRSKKMFDILRFAKQISSTNSTVMIYGETGTGKELIAKLIHNESNRSSRPFVPIDCTSLPENLLESELFGHEKGAFTGADTLKKGLFEVAHGGTVFLDEIGELPMMLQSKLLRVLETKSFRRVGGERYIDTDVRVIAATNRKLKRMCEENLFRSDLFYRLNVLSINLPSLRERKEDIFPLVEYFVRIYNKKIGRNIKGVTNEVLQYLIDHDWPGNIRELKNVMESMVIMTKGDVIPIENLPSEIYNKHVKISRYLDGLLEKESGALPDFREAKKETIDRFEKKYLTVLLEKNNWNISQCAREIQMHRSGFQRLMKKHGVSKNNVIL